MSKVLVSWLTKRKSARARDRAVCDDQLVVCVSYREDVQVSQLFCDTGSTLTGSLRGWSEAVEGLNGMSLGAFEVLAKKFNW